MKTDVQATPQQRKFNKGAGPKREVKQRETTRDPATGRVTCGCGVTLPEAFVAGHVCHYEPYSTFGGVT